MLRIRLLGRFELRRDGQLIDLASRPAQSLLAFLVLNPGIRHRREKLAGIFWPDVDERKARDKLRYALWQVRHTVGETCFVTDRIHVAFDANCDYWLDAAALQVTGARGLATDELLEIVAAYQGELLPGFYSEWVLAERDRLLARFETTAAELLQRLASEKRWLQLRTVAEQWIALGRSPEPAFRALMVAHSAVGDVGGAVRTYERCVQQLREHLGLTPAAETQGLYQAILRGEQPSASARSFITPGLPRHDRALSFPLPAAARLASEASGVFVGREHEFAILDNWLVRARRGKGRVGFIRGEAGRGKSSLLQAFCRRALRQHDELVVAAGSGEAQSGIGDPHLPFRDLLSLLSGDVEKLSAMAVISHEAIRRLWQLVPETAEAVSSLGPDLIGTLVAGEPLRVAAQAYAAVEAAWSDRLLRQITARESRPLPINIQHSDLQKALFDQCVSVLQRLAAIRPLLLILDDLQWADTGTTSLLFHLGRRVDGHRILVLVAYRSDQVGEGWDGEQHPLLSVRSELIRQFGDTEIDLDRTDERERRRFVDALLDTEPNRLDAAFRDAFFRHTGGYPLYTVELLRQMKAQGDLRADQSGRWVRGSSLEWEALPARVEAVIAGRVNRLEPQVKAMLRVAAVEGEVFSAEVVAAVTGKDMADVIRVLSQELGRRHLLVEARGIQEVDGQRISRYRFRHHLFQDFVYSSLDEVEKAHLHESVARTLEQLHGRHTEHLAVRLAQHFKRADRKEEAVDYLLKAGEVAKRQSANTEAIVHLREGLRLLATLSHSRDRDERELVLQIALAAPLVATKGYAAPEAETAYARARKLSEHVGNKTQMAQAVWGLWSFYLTRAKHVTARGLAAQISSLARAASDPDLWLVAHWTSGISLMHLGYPYRASVCLQEAIATYDHAQHGPLTYLYGQNPAITCLTYAAVASWLLGYPEMGRECSETALNLVGEIAHPFSTAFTHGMTALFHGLRREPEPALRHAQKAVSIAREEGFPFLLALGLAMRGWARAAMGRRSMAARQIRHGLDAMDAIGAELGKPIFLFFLADVARMEERTDEGLTILTRALQLADASGDHLNEADLYRLKGELLFQQGEVASAVVCAQRAVALARRQLAKALELRALVTLCQVAQNGTVREKARRELAICCRHFDQSATLPDLEAAQMILQRRTK